MVFFLVSTILVGQKEKNLCVHRGPGPSILCGSQPQVPARLQVLSNGVKIFPFHRSSPDATQMLFSADVAWQLIWGWFLSITPPVIFPDQQLCSHVPVQLFESYIGVLPGTSWRNWVLFAHKPDKLINQCTLFGPKAVFFF